MGRPLCVKGKVEGKGRKGQSREDGGREGKKEAE